MLGQYTINIHLRFDKLMGNKGAGLLRMRNLGLPVPPAFVVFCDATSRFKERGPDFIKNELAVEVFERLAELEKTTGRQYGNPDKPLLLSVRSGSPVSMPGMMDTILNVGFNDEVREGMARRTGNHEFALDCHLRFLEMVSRTIFILDHESLPQVCKSGPGWRDDLLKKYKEVIGKAAAMTAFPNLLNDVRQQLLFCIMGVFSSWQNERAVRYRKLFKIDESIGLGIVIQTMVFGNLDDRSATGVVFSRDPSTGLDRLTGEYLTGHQGEDVVSGEYADTAKPISQLSQESPDIYKAIVRACRLLEYRNGDIQDIEFTIEHGRLYFLQVRAAKSTPLAKLQFLVDAVGELMSEKEALRRASLIPKDALRANLLQNKVIANGAEGGWIFARGTGVSPGVTQGRLVLSQQSPYYADCEGDVIMATQGARTADIMGKRNIRGWFTSAGGAVSHATIVCRELGIPCVVNTGILIDRQKGTVTGLNGKLLPEGETLTVDGSTGLVCGGNPRIKDVEINLALAGLLNKLL